MATNTNFLRSLHTAQALLSNLKDKLQPLTSFSVENKENRSNFANKSGSASEQMEILWLKSTIDALCADNALFFKEINEILRILEALGLKYKQLKDEKTRDFPKQTQNYIVSLEKSLENEKVRLFSLNFHGFYRKTEQKLKTFARNQRNAGEIREIHRIPKDLQRRRAQRSGNRRANHRETHERERIFAETLENQRQLPGNS